MEDNLAIFGLSSLSKVGGFFYWSIICIFLGNITHTAMSKLNEKQKRFCEEYLIDLNAAAAARRAGYSEKTAKQIGTENLSKPYIKSYIDKLKKKRSEQTGVDAEFVVNYLKSIVTSDFSDLGQTKGGIFKIKSLDEIPKPLRMLIQEIRNTKDGVVIKICDKMKALEMIARHINMFEKELKAGSKVEQVFKIGDTEIKF